MKRIWKQKQPKKTSRPKIQRRLWKLPLSAEGGKRKKKWKPLLQQKLHPKHLKLRRRLRVLRQKKMWQRQTPMLLLSRRQPRRQRMTCLKQLPKRRTMQTFLSLPFLKHNSTCLQTQKKITRRRTCWHNCRPRLKTVARSKMPHRQRRSMVFGKAILAMAQTLSLPLISPLRIKERCPTTTCLTIPPLA